LPRFRLSAFACFFLDPCSVHQNRIACALLAFGQGSQNHAARGLLLKRRFQGDGLAFGFSTGLVRCIVSLLALGQLLAPLHDLDGNRFRSAMREALTHGPGTAIRWARLQRQRCLGWNAQCLVAGVIRVAHPVRRPAFVQTLFSFK
jgi:hypothetical protein